jgi:hypothetical protein
MKELIELLNMNEYYGVSENIDFAKGKYQLPYTWKDAWSKIKRHSKKKNDNLITWKDIWNKIKSLKWQIRK